MIDEKLVPDDKNESKFDEEIDDAVLVTLNEDDTVDQLPEDDTVQAIKDVFSSLEEFKSAYLQRIHQNTTRLEDFKNKETSIPEGTPSFFVILRQWNSFTPILPQASSSHKGGGYFLYSNGYGLVIDPGYNFMENFLEYGLVLSDINGVLISHAHNDHTVELESLFSLLYKKNKNLPIEKRQKIDLYLNLGSFKKYANYFDLSIEKEQPLYLNKIHLLNPYQTYLIGNNQEQNEFSFFTLPAKHHEMITSSYALGFIFKCGQKTIRLTCDTGWNSDLESQNQYMSDILNYNKVPQIDLLIAHIGSIKEREFNFNFNETLIANEQREDEDSVFYKNHLGLLGCICMMKRWNPSLTVISEIGEELKDLRINLPDLITNSMKINTISSDIGLTIRLTDLAIYCQKTKRFCDYRYIRTTEKNGRLAYVDENHLDQIEKNDLKAESLLSCIVQANFSDILDALTLDIETEHEM